MLFWTLFTVTVRCRSRSGVAWPFSVTVTFTCLLAIRPMSAGLTPCQGYFWQRKIQIYRRARNENKQDGGKIAEHCGKLFQRKLHIIFIISAFSEPYIFLKSVTNELCHQKQTSHGFNSEQKEIPECFVLSALFGRLIMQNVIEALAKIDVNEPHSVWVINIKERF